MSFKRDRYISAFDNDTCGVLAASYDISTALLLLHNLARMEGLSGVRYALRDGTAYTLGQLIEIAECAMNTSIDPALNVYQRLQGNADAAHAMAEGFPSDTEWAEMDFALARTLYEKPIASRGEVSRARRIISRKSAARARSVARHEEPEVIPEGGAA